MPRTHVPLSSVRESLPIQGTTPPASNRRHASSPLPGNAASSQRQRYRYSAAIVITSAFLESPEGWVGEAELGSEVVYGVWIHLWRGELAEARHLIDRPADVSERASTEALLIQIGKASARGRVWTS